MIGLVYDSVAGTLTQRSESFFTLYGALYRQRTLLRICLAHNPRAHGVTMLEISFLHYIGY